MPQNDGILLRHTALAAVTALVPIPILDVVLCGYVTRRMARALAQAHGLSLAEPEIEQLCDDDLRKILGGTLRGLLLAPIRLLLRRLGPIFVGNAVVARASECYHRGFLLDQVFTERLCAPAGTKSPRQVRAAIDEVLRERPVTTSPVTHALRVGLVRARAGLGEAFIRLRDRLAGRPAANDQATVAEAVEDTQSSGLDAVVAQLTRALRDTPREHLDHLAGRVKHKLAT
jgi:uncharacterized protein (DUF697 family)